MKKIQLFASGLLLKLLNSKGFFFYRSVLHSSSFNFFMKMIFDFFYSFYRFHINLFDSIMKSRRWKIDSTQDYCWMIFLMVLNRNRNILSFLNWISFYWLLDIFDGVRSGVMQGWSWCECWVMSLRPWAMELPMKKKRKNFQGWKFGKTINIFR